MTARYWFKPKQYGYGATPVTWEGWAFTIFVAALLVVAGWYLLGGRSAPSIMALLIWAVFFAAVVAGSVVMAKSRTEGSWKWRWGDPE